MNVLSFDKQCRLVSALADGNSIRGAGRIVNAHRDSVMHDGLEIGEGCARLHDVLFCDLQVDVMEIDEIWSFVKKKQKRVKDKDPAEFGDCYTFVAMDATKKAIVSFLVDKRTADAATIFARDVARRAVNRPQITTDGFAPYPLAVAAAFGYQVDYAQIIKQYANSETEDVRYSRSKCTSSRKIPQLGDPDWDRISTSYIERQNLTMRMSMRRFTRLTNAFSKKLKNHRAAIGLYVAFYNLCRVHETVKATPAQALGVTDHVWAVAELIDAARSIAPEPEPVQIQVRPLVIVPESRQLDLFDRPQRPALNVPIGTQMEMFY